MYDEKVYCAIDAVTPSSDKKVRGRSIQGRMAMKMVRFPKFAAWWPDARHQLLKFPHATHDDFVDWMSWLGLGLTKELRPATPVEDINTGPKYGTLAWVKSRSAITERRERFRKASVGF